MPKPLLLPLPPSFFPSSALESAPINLGNQLHKHSSQSTRWAALFRFTPLLHHHEFIWIHGGLQETRIKAQNGSKIFPKMYLELMGPSHVGFGLQNHQNQCSIQVGPTNRLNRLPTSLAGWDKNSNLDRISLKEQGIHKKRYVIRSSDKGNMAKNKAECLVFEPTPMNSNWTEVLGRPHFLPLAWCE